MSKRGAKGVWHPINELNVKRRNRCRVRMVDGRELGAIWGPHEMRDGSEAWCWAASDDQGYGLLAVKEFKLLYSLPVGRHREANARTLNCSPIQPRVSTARECCTDGS